MDEASVGNILREMCEKVVKRYKQELTGESEEVLDRTLRKYKARVARRTWHVSQKWCKWTEGGPVLMPDCTRMYYKKGQTEVIVQEFYPQTRLMKFKGVLVNDDEDKICTYSLALPYMVFIYKFVEGMFQECYIAFSDCPLRKLQERPMRPYLSNIDANLKLCHGASFNRGELIKDNLIQQVAFVLDHFWQTIYSDEWSNHFYENQRHFEEDSRLKTLKAWEAASEENPFFVIDDVDWLPHHEENFGDMIVRLFENDTIDANFQQELYNDLVDNFLEEVKRTWQDSLQIEHKILDDIIEETKCSILATK